MLSIKKCKTILEDDGEVKFSEEEVIAIRAFLYQTAQIVIDSSQNTSEDAA